MKTTDNVYAVMCVDISDGSDYCPKLLNIRPSREAAMNEALGHMKIWLDKNCPKKSLSEVVRDGIANFCTLHIYDTETCSGIQLNVQEIHAAVTFGIKMDPTYPA